MKSTSLRIAVVLLAMASVSTMAFAQFPSNAPQISLNATMSESLTVALSANAVSFNLAAGGAANPGSTNITATTTWVLKPGRTAVGIYAYFANSAAALSDGGTPANNIPSADFFISDNGGASAALTNTVAYGGSNAGLQLANVAITGANKSSSHTDVMAFNINLSSLPQLPAGSYTGTLNIAAQATP
jgi:hypothetical protein